MVDRDYINAARKALAERNKSKPKIDVCSTDRQQCQRVVRELKKKIK